MTDPGGRPGRLADELTASGQLTDDWRAAFLSVPRHAFIPEVIWREDGKLLIPLRRGRSGGLARARLWTRLRHHTG